MADIIDDANEAAEMHLKAALSKKRDSGPSPNGYCHNCGCELPPDRPFCDADCRDDFEYRERREAEQYG